MDISVNVFLSLPFQLLLQKRLAFVFKHFIPESAVQLQRVDDDDDVRTLDNVSEM